MGGKRIPAKYSLTYLGFAATLHNDQTYLSIATQFKVFLKFAIDSNRVK